jgi:hypothetical protein
MAGAGYVDDGRAVGGEGAFAHVQIPVVAVSVKRIVHNPHQENRVEQRTIRQEAN